MVWDGTRWVRDTAAARRHEPESAQLPPRGLAFGRAVRLAIAAVLVGCIVGVAMPMVPSAAASPSIALDPSLALPGTTVRLRGDNLPPHARFHFMWDGQPSGAGMLEANARGVIRARYTIPADLPGRHEFAIVPEAGQAGLDPALALATTPFVVAEIGEPTPSLPGDVEGLATGEPDPSASPSPTAAPTAAPRVASKPATKPVGKPAPRPTKPPTSGGYWSVPFLHRTASAPIRITGRSNVTISGKQFTNLANGTVAIIISNSSNVTIVGNDFSNVTGAIYAVNSSNVKVMWNRFRNIGNGTIGSGHSNYIQFNNTWGGYITHNKGIGGNTEDLVSVYRSGGSAASPLLIEYNQFEGTNWSSGSGSGLMLGDAGGRFITAAYNVLVSPGQVGIGVPGGTNIRILNNTIYGAQRSRSNVGLYVWNQSGSGCSAIEVRGNKVHWYNAGGSLNGSWNGGGCGTVAGWSANSWTASISVSALHVRL